ncbi:N-acyl-L-amino acid amidohydrolase [Alkalibacterium sp. AK22]|uniref:amidohydrolase n=1 Tax=Alkalibacterium sp. AK22 TaxID=1229520 RepID=UPI000449CCA3|nr:amidohydrolase [Alkalibacterium sp. AK22]EXJ22728.1 N-acyl-L-amino acid amidohydrolase [Alkalibacterium sp. AK22]
MSQLSIETSITEKIRACSRDIIELRRYFHQHPEPSLKEFETIRRIKEELDTLDIPYESVGETGVIGTIEGQAGPGKTILLRADIDALELEDAKDTVYRSKNPGLNHACGHDGHTAALLGAARVLKEQAEYFPGTIRLAFQQAEEIGAGARQFVQGGFVEGVDQVFGLHLDSSVLVGEIVSAAGATNACCDIFKIQVKGQSAHAARPDKGVDALLAAAALTVELQSIVGREVSPLDHVVVGVGVLNAGTRYNIVANQAELEGTVRAFSHEARASVLEAVERVARRVGEAHRAEIHFENYDAAAPLINGAEPAARAARVAANIVGEAHVITSQPKSLGADDFADFLAEAPGVYARVGTRDPKDEGTWHGHHHELFDIAEEGLIYAAELHVRYALDYLNS